MTDTYSVIEREPMRSGAEVDVLTHSRRFYCYTQRSGVCHRIKRQHRRRLRHRLSRMARSYTK